MNLRDAFEPERQRLLAELEAEKANPPAIPPFKQGEQAFNYDKPLTANPFPQDAPEHAQWVAGWNAAQKLEAALAAPDEEPDEDEDDDQADE
jgi:hypothetical protein